MCLLLNDSLCKWDWLYFKEVSCSCLAGLRSRSRPCLSCWFDLHLGRVLLLREKKKWCTHVWGSLCSCWAWSISALPTHQSLGQPQPLTSGPNSFLAFSVFLSEKFASSNVKLLNIINHARNFVWNFRWTSFNWYIIVLPLAIGFKWFHA